METHSEVAPLLPRRLSSDASCGRDGTPRLSVTPGCHNSVDFRGLKECADGPHILQSLDSSWSRIGMSRCRRWVALMPSVQALPRSAPVLPSRSTCHCLKLA